MFTEIMKIKPVMDSAQLNRMFSDLSSRFGNVAKKFGGGMKNALKFGGVMSLIGIAVAKIMNPLERAEELFHKTINQGDDAVTNANELGTTPGKLMKLQALAGMKGISPEEFRTLIGKFQGKLAAEQDAASKPGRIQQQLDSTTDPMQRQILRAQLAQAQIDSKGGLLKEFAGIKDVGDAFLQFIQTVGALDPARRTTVQSDVFGEKLRGKASELVNSDPKELAKLLASMPETQRLGSAAQKAGEVSDYMDQLTVLRGLDSFLVNANNVDKKKADDIDKAARLADSRDSDALKNFDQTKTAAIAIQELTNKFEKFTMDMMVSFLPQIVDGIKKITEVLPSVADTKKGIDSALDTVIPPVANYVQNVTDTFSDPAQALRNDVARMQSFLEGVWAEFKTSRLYRIIGG